MNGVTAEVAEEIFVFLEDGDLMSIAGEEIAEHHSGGTPAYDAAASLCGFGGGRSHRWSEGSNCPRLRQTRIETSFLK